MIKENELAWVPLLVPDMPEPEELLSWLEEMHQARHYSNFGPLVKKLEKELSRKLGVEPAQVVTVANATLGLELVLQALNLAPGSNILLPAFTFVATATAVLRAGHRPVLADIDPNTWMLMPETAFAISERMRIDAVLPVATFGMPHDMQAWQRFQKETGIPVIVDAAAAYGSQFLEDTEATLVFSLHTTKSLPSGEGGLIVSKSHGLINRVRQLSNFGININSSASWPSQILVAPGTNAKMSEYHAAIGLASLRKWDEYAKKRRFLHASFKADINKITQNKFEWQKPGKAGSIKAPTLLCPKLPSAKVRLELEMACQKAKIMTRRWYQPLLPHIEALQEKCLSLPVPNAEEMAQTLLGLPFFTTMESVQHQRIIDVIASTFRDMN